MAELDPFIATVCWYGIPTVDSRVVAHGAISIYHLPLPILAFSPTGPYDVVGKIESVSDGEDDGTPILVIMGVADPDAMPRDENGDPFYGLGMDLDCMEAEFSGGLMIITAGRLMAATITPKPAFPKSRLIWVQ